MSTRRNLAIAAAILALLALIGIFTITGLTLHEVEEIEDSTCDYEESIACWDGNGCHASLRRRICREEGTAALTSTGTCTSANYVCENPTYPDGTCCNQNDFCFLDDPNKTCQQGQCVSTDPTLCKGFCTVDADCTDSAFPFPIYPTASSTTFCLNGACFAYVYAFSPVISPNDLLNRTTLAARNISSCIESSCFVFDIDGDIQVCQYAWTCSQLNGFSDQEIFTKKRGLLGSAQPLVHNFTLPGGGGRYSRGQYNEANAGLNARLTRFVDSIRATNAPTSA
jgi:hypothetical protein